MFASGRGSEHSVVGRILLLFFLLGREALVPTAPHVGAIAGAEADFGQSTIERSPCLHGEKALSRIG